MNDHSDPFIVDELVRRLSADMGQVSSQGTLVNLYVNGVYKGYYNPTERIDEDFLDTWQGGNGDYDIIAQFGEVRAGDLVKWQGNCSTSIVSSTI
jgi:spore coat protein CotH